MRYTLTKESLLPILKVVGWSVGSALVASLILIVDEVEFPPEYAFLVPIINIVLYTVKEFISDKDGV